MGARFKWPIELCADCGILVILTANKEQRFVIPNAAPTICQRRLEGPLTDDA